MVVKEVSKTVSQTRSVRKRLSLRRENGREIKLVCLTLDLAALLDSEADLHGLVLHVLPQLADDLVNLEALSLLLVRHDCAAVLVGDVDALLLVGGAAHAVEVGLGHLLAIPVPIVLVIVSAAAE